MARPRKTQDYLVHRLSELFQYANQLPWHELKQGGEFGVMLGTRVCVVTNVDEIYRGIGELLCRMKPQYRPQIMRQVTDVLKRKPRRSTPDNVAKIRAAYQDAQAEYLPAKIKPTFREVDAKYRKSNKGTHLDRRDLPADCPVRYEKARKKNRHGPM
jgi:hypothetical protein